MPDDFTYCPIEACKFNHACTCTAGMPKNYTMVGGFQANNFFGAATPSVLPTGLIAEGIAPTMPQWRNWKSCPYYRKLKGDDNVNHD